MKKKLNLFFTILLTTIILVSGIVIAASTTESAGATETQIYESASRYAYHWSVAEAEAQKVKNNENSSVVIQSGYDTWTTDSEKYVEAPSVQLGKTVETGLVTEDKQKPKIADDSKQGYHEVTEMTLTLYRTDLNYTKEDLANEFWNTVADQNSSEAQNAYNEMLNQNNLNVTPYLKQYGEAIEVKITYDENGKEYITFPDDFKDGQYVIVAVGVDGETMILDNYDQLMLQIGDPSKFKDLDPEPDPDPEPGNGSWWSELTKSVTNFNHSVPSIKSNITNSNYEAETAIPTSENLDFTVTADDSLYNIDVRTYTRTAGVNNIKIAVQAKYYYDCSCPVYKVVDGKTVRVKEVVKHPGEKHTGYITYTAVESYTHSISPQYFYDVPTSDISPVESATIIGAPTGNVTVSLHGGPTNGNDTISLKNTSLNYRNTYTYTIPGTYSSYSKAKNDYKSAEHVSKAKEKIENILLNAYNLRGSCNYSYRGLNVKTRSSNFVEPSIVKTSNTVTQMIPKDKRNDEYVTWGTANYSGESFQFNPNNVTVHTPVVNNTKVTSESFINQKVNKEKKTYLQLDKKFTVEIPDKGTHISQKGYNTRKYNSNQAVPKESTNWGKIKDVKLSFDTYLIENEGQSNETKTFIKSGDWLSEHGKATSSNKYRFIIPVWAEEGDNTVYTRVIAENASIDDYSQTQAGANFERENYVATCEVPVEIIGKIYDLRISSTNDLGWTKLKGKSGDFITASEFPFGKSGQNANKTYRYAPKLGYTVSFDFKTKGIKSNNVDVKVANNGFYFVSKKDGSVTPVDLYYSTTTKKYVKLDSNSNVSIITNLTYPYMKVPQVELNDSYRIMKNIYNYNSNVNIGTLSKMNLPENLRMCYNNLAECIKLYGQTENNIYGNATNGHDYSGVWKARTNAKSGKDVVIGSVGHWWAGYRLPGTTIAVPKNKNITSDTLTKSGGKEAMKNGYIMVKFDIASKYNEWEYLQYTGPESLADGNYEKDSNEKTLDWTNYPSEKPTTQTVSLPNGIKAELPIGTCVLFESDYANSKDVEGTGTH